MSKGILFRTLAAAMTFIVAGFYQTLYAQSWGDGTYHEGMLQMMWGGQLPMVSASGKAIIDSGSVAGMMDTSRSHFRYFLDSAGNGQRRYQLFFGPYWYNPPSGASRPQSGQTVTVRGGLLAGMVPPMLSVVTMGGLMWRDSLGAPPWGGHWVHRSTSDSTRVFCDGDSLSWTGIPPGAMGSGMMGGGMMMWPDSMFMDFSRMLPDSLPFMMHGGALYGFHMTAFNPAGMFMMQGGMMGGQGMMAMQKAMHLRIGIRSDTLVRHGLKLSQMRLRYLASDSTWKDVPGQTQDAQGSTINADQLTVSPYLALSPSGATAVEEPASRPAVFSLDQNYPNPFNPSTSIRFALPRETFVRLEIFNLLGQRIATLVSEDLPAGVYTKQWNAAGSPSGVYFYKMTAGGFVQVKRLVLAR